ncbi:gas vesicle protein [Brachybacterium endophyticum]|uniref:Gas vesicle protein n=1 Tax=Brachybacterium endophyticum TaxID=2182385 RepID=A0A2U2RKR5_9MICO|nr:gas vesicle protein [Brachybacterium endophyticum]PWH06472.1 gas vesicle protein [Brachybacterium endophyticum]
MQPNRDPRATLPDLLEVLLNKGVHLNLDLIISVADVPLIGVNLRATIAGMETMLEYGMMNAWDRDTRAWVQKSLSAHLPLAEGEEVIAKMAGGHYHEGFYRTWRPGTAYLTNRRLIIHRRDPVETLWQAPLASITAIEPIRERSIGGESRTRLHVTLEDESRSMLSAVDPERLISLVRGQLGHSPAAEADELPGAADGPVLEGPMWYLETRAEGGTWRAGHASLTEADGLVWKSPLDGRARVRTSLLEDPRYTLEEHENPTDEQQVLVLDSAAGTTRLAAPDVVRWHEELTTRKGAGDGARG